MKEDFILVKHENLTDNCLNKIICVKRQFWKYSLESQRKWIQSSMKIGDIHLLMHVYGQFIAYLSINVVNISVDDQVMFAKGLGNVCVAKGFQGQGFGKKIVEKANKIIKENNDTGILLCHRHLISFYERCGWHNVTYDNVEIEQKKFTNVIMLFNNDLQYVSYMKLDRIF